MNGNLLILPIVVPAVGGLLAFLLPSRRLRWAAGALAVLVSVIQAALAILLFPLDLSFTIPWLGMGMDFALRLTRLSAFILLAVAGFGLLVSLYASRFMAGSPSGRQFHAWLLLTLSFAAGAALADNLVLLLGFWEGLLLTQFAMIAAGKTRAFRTAIKAFIIVGVSDLALMLGVMLTSRLAGTLTMSAIRLPLDGLGSAAFLLMAIGAMGKAGAMPFHSWIPDAALDAPLPFMAILPASIEKLLGIYLLARVSLDLFALVPGSWVSMALMTVGALTILLAVMMALVQKDFKRLLSYHAISQVGYMILGIGTALPVGIVGGLFHMVNHAMYKSCLFLTGGSVEKQAGTTDLTRLGGLARSMPVTTPCFIVAAASISGVPPFNGFFSKELVYDGALERGWIFYAAALLGSLLTAASFLKLGHAAFFGKRADNAPQVKEAPPAMLAPMIVLAGLCVLFGVANRLPLEGFIQPGVSSSILQGVSFAGWPAKSLLVWLTLAVLAAAGLNHWYGVRRSGSGLGAVDHIHRAPVLAPIYSIAEKGRLDPYWIGRWAVKGISAALWGIDRGVDWLYDALAVKSALGLTALLRRLHNGRVNRYLLWSLAGGAAIVIAVVAWLGAGR